MKKSTRLYLIATICFILIISSLFLLIGSVPPSSDLAMVVLMTALIIPGILCITASHRRQKEKEWEYFCLPQEEIERMKADETVVSVTYVGSESASKLKVSKVSLIARSLIGGALRGPVGAAAGAMTAKTRMVTRNSDATFIVKYASGRCESETVRIDGKRYRELVQYLSE